MEKVRKDECAGDEMREVGAGGKDSTVVRGIQG